MDKQIAPFSPPGPLDKSTFGGLSLRQEVLDGFMSIRDQHHQLQGILHQTMRRVVLPRAREIGQALEKVKSYYEPAKKGPGGKASAFYTDCKAVAGLGKTQAAGYIRIATEWHRLIDYMADLPEGADPVLSLGAALNAIAEMNKAARPALPGTAGAVDVEAEDVAATAGKSARGTRYVHGTRERVLPALVSLKATPVGQKHQARLEALYQDLIDLLDEMEQEEQGGPAEEWSEPEPVVAAAEESIAVEEPAPAAVREEPTPAERVNLGSLFPVSTPGESYEAMSELIVQHGGGAAAAKALGCAWSSFRNHRSRLKKAMESGQGQG